MVETFNEQERKGEPTDERKVEEFLKLSKQYTIVFGGSPFCDFSYLQSTTV